MTDKRKKYCAVFAAMLIMSLFTGCSTQGAKNTADSRQYAADTAMYDSSYWTGKDKNAGKILMYPDEIIEFNTRILASSCGVEDIVFYPDALSAAELTSRIKDHPMPEGSLYFDNGDIAFDIEAEDIEAEKEKYIERVTNNCALGSVAEANAVRYAAAVRDGEIRTYPFSSRADYSDSKKTNDFFLAGTYLTGEPMLILYTSEDTLWNLVQTRTCCGWVLSANIAAMEKGDWINYINADEFIIVTDRAVTMTASDTSSYPVTLKIGTKLPIYKTNATYANGQGVDGNYIVKYPSRDENGNAVFSQLLIPIADGVHYGYLNYTPENVIKLAMQLSGQKINPKGLNGGWDRSSFITSIFSCFGIYLPESVEKICSIEANDKEFKIASTKDVVKALDSALPGTLIFTGDSAGIYLGKEDEKYYILHPAVSFFINDIRRTANSFIITDTDIVFENGSTLLNSIVRTKVFSAE